MSRVGGNIGEVDELFSTMREEHLDFDKKRDEKWEKTVNGEKRKEHLDTLI